MSGVIVIRYVDRLYLAHFRLFSVLLMTMFIVYIYIYIFTLPLEFMIV